MSASTAIQVSPHLQSMLDVSIPDDLDGITALIDCQIQLGRRAALVISLCIAQARRTPEFTDDPAGWLTWGLNKFGYSRRHCFTCLKAGMLILSADSQKCDMSHLLGCDLVKLEILANIPSQQLPALLKRWNPAEATRDEVRAKAKLWEDPGEGDDEDSDEEEEKKTEPQKRPKHTSTVEQLVDRVALLTDEEKLAIIPHLDPAAGMRASFSLLDMIVYQLQQDNYWSPEQYEYWLEAYDEVGEKLRELKKGEIA